MGFFDRPRAPAPDPDEAELEALTEDMPWSAGHPADRLPGESAEDWALFTAYCSEDTTIAAFARKVHDRSESSIRRLAWVNAWERRRAALRAALGRDFLEAASASAREHGAEAGRVVALMSTILVDSLMHHAARGSKLSLGKLPGFARVMLDAANLLDGKPTEIREHRLTDASPEDLNELETLLERIETRTEH